MPVAAAASPSLEHPLRGASPLWKRHQQIAGCHAGIQGAGNGSANIAIQCMDNHRPTGRFLHTSCFGPALADLRVPAPHSVAHPRSRVAIPYDRPQKPCLHYLWQRCERLRRGGAFLLGQAHPTPPHTRTVIRAPVARTWYCIGIVGSLGLAVLLPYSIIAIVRRRIAPSSLVCDVNAPIMLAFAVRARRRRLDASQSYRSE